VHHDQAALERANQSFRHEMWMSIVPDAVDEQGIEAQRFGPVLATAFGSEPREPELNLIQGAAEPGAIAEGHVAGAVEWMRSREVEYRVPVAEGLPDTATAEQWLGGHGYERGDARAVFVRDATPPDLPEDPGIEVFELGEEEADGEGFSHLVREGGGLPGMAETLFFSLPVREGWRCYTAAPQPGVVAAGAMLIEDGLAVLGLDATIAAERGRGCNRALLRRRLLDAAAAGCHTVVAEVAEGDECAGLRHNLLAAGFTQAYAGRDWQRPALRPAISA
jgi:hypothetical protein